MSVIGKHWYRETFLKSDEWKTFSSQVRADNDGKCFVCGLVEWDNDVHHVWYGEPSYTGARQFVVLCRRCHELVHGVFEARAARTEIDKVEAWTTFKELRGLLRIRLNNETVRIPVKRLNKDKPRKRCRGCLCDAEKTKWIHPITQTLSEYHHTGCLSLCDECIGKLKEKFKPVERGRAKMWDDIKMLLKEIPKKDLTEPSGVLDWRWIEL